MKAQTVLLNIVISINTALTLVFGAVLLVERTTSYVGCSFNHLSMLAALGALFPDKIFPEARSNTTT